ncbi:hypothetical protein C2S53_007741 [Perilla frutescens var. hirtella]|uniref:Ribosomal protein L34Ae n=1 Tax=Perilla frutescens var. hirtella TaxID=608512 RepID=A0AAD4P0T9_PERFH|nr:hypothetical protein C2S53_007741 [Perilla frutescens var. hirtella]
MFRFGSFFLASLYSLMFKILGLIYKHVHRSKSSLAEENGSNFSENRSQLDDEAFSKNPNVVLAGGIDGKESFDLHSNENDLNETTESSVSLQSSLVSQSSKCQVVCGENVSGFLEEPTTQKFVVQELFVEADYVVVCSDQTLASETCDKNGLFDQNLENDRKEFDEGSEFSPFYFKLLNASFPTNEETVENESEIGLCGEDEVDEKKEKQEFSGFRVEDEDFAYEVELTRESASEMESTGLCGEERQVDEKKETPDEDFTYEVELNPSGESSSLVADQKSDGISISLQKIEENDSENWMSSFLDETDGTKSEFKHWCEEVDDEYIELEMDKESESASSSCADANMKSSEEGDNCWDSDSDEPDVLSEHQHLVQQMKMELKNCSRIRGLPTISEESETPKMIEDLKPLQIDHKIGYKDVMEGIQKFYKSYTEKMRKLDILNYQTSHAISFLQLKESEVYEKNGNSSSSLSSSSNSVLPKMWHGKVGRKRRIYADPMQKWMNEIVRDLEVVYVGQVCLSWEILWWLDARARELLEYDEGEGRHSYNRAAEEFQQFQVLLQRFMEDEQFQGRRNDNYVRSRCIIRSLLQVPTIKDDCLKTNKERREERDAISLEMLVETIRESILIFQDFVFADRINAALTKVDDHQESCLHKNLLDIVVSSLHEKERRMREVIRRQKCIVQRLKKNEERRWEWDRELVASQVDLRLVSRVLNMSRFTGDHLVWCQNKLNNITFLGRNLHRDTSFLLFPC